MKKKILTIITALLTAISYGQPCNFSLTEFIITRMPGNIYCNSIQVKHLSVPTNEFSFTYRNNHAPYNSGGLIFNSSTHLYETNTDLPSGSYTIIGQSGGCSDSTLFNFTAYILPEAIISGPNCFNTAGVLTMLPNDSALENIEWKLNNTVVQTTNAAINPYGITVAGGNGRGTNTNQLYVPHKPFVDAAGNLYVAELGGRVSKWLPGASEGIVVANNVAAAGLFVDDMGNIYIADRSSHQVVKWAAGASEGVTVAGGNGEGAALNQLNNPNDVYVDAKGNLFIADFYNDRIVKWAPGSSEGVIVIDGLGHPCFITFDAGGNLFICEQTNNRISKLAPGAASVTVVAGGNGAGAAPNQLNTPAGVAVDAFGNIFISDENNQRIQKWTNGATEGTTITGTGNVGDQSNEFNNPVAICLDRNGNLYVADGYNERVQKFIKTIVPTYTALSAGTYSAGIIDNNGCKTTSPAFLINDQPKVSITGKSTACTGIGNTITASGASTYTWFPGNLSGATQIFTSNTAGVSIYQVVGSNSTNSCFDTAFFAIKTFINPTVKISGNTCINDTFSATIKRSSAENFAWSYNNNVVQTNHTAWEENATTAAGGNGAGQLANQFQYPAGTFIDNTGNLYVMDALNFRVQKFTPGSTQGITVAGGNGNGSGPNQLSYAFGIFVDRYNNLFVADEYNHRIQKWAPNATVGVTVAGGNGMGNNANQLAYPIAVIVDELGNLYISELGNSRVQKWLAGDTKGITIAGGNGSGNALNQLAYPWGISLDPFNNLYVSEGENHRVTKWIPGTTQGMIVAGGSSGSAHNQLNNPRNITFDGIGNIYVVDYGNNRVQKWRVGDSSGITVAGIGGTGSAPNQLNQPIGISLYNDGSLYVSDAANNRIQKFKNQIDSTYIPTVAGQYRVQANDFNGCSATSNTLTIKSTRPKTPGNITGQSNNLCGGGIFNYSVASMADVNSFTWTVAGNCNIIDGQGTTSINISVPPDFKSGYVSVMANHSCSGLAGNARTLILSTLPSKPIEILGPAAVTPNQMNVQFSVWGSEQNVMYNWSVPSGVVIVAGQGTDTLTVNWGNKKGTISVYAYNGCGNSLAINKKITIETALAKNKSSVVPGRETNIYLYPNPAKGGLLTIGFKLPLNAIASVKVYDALGQVVLRKEHEFINNNLELNINGLHAGIYQVTVTTGDKLMVTKLVVK